MPKHIYSHEELVMKLEEAQRELYRLKSVPDQSLQIAQLRREYQSLWEHLQEIIKQRDDLLLCVRRHLGDSDV